GALQPPRGISCIPHSLCFENTNGNKKKAPLERIVLPPFTKELFPINYSIRRGKHKVPKELKACAFEATSLRKTAYRSP
ncbi:hypothetical protein, partial [Paenibacillus xylaniclasticus]|uniref:hypothetical protein n=1 Tax=Paenibacillus xylaniclasticus TaxID=588083 RepID=UPI001C3F7600